MSYILWNNLTFKLNSCIINEKIQILKFFSFFFFLQFFNNLLLKILKKERKQKHSKFCYNSFSGWPRWQRVEEHQIKLDVCRLCSVFVYNFKLSSMILFSDPSWKKKKKKNGITFHRFEWKSTRKGFVRRMREQKKKNWKRSWLAPHALARSIVNLSLGNVIFELSSCIKIFRSF